MTRIMRCQASFSTPFSSTTRSAFSLIELLVVATIIAVLAGMLLPAIKMIKIAAQGARCGQSMRGFGVALLAYSVDFDSMIPPNSYFLNPAWKRWYDYINPYIAEDVPMTQKWCPAWGRTDLLNIYAYNSSNAFKANGNSNGFQLDRFRKPAAWMFMGEACVSGYGILDSYTFAPWNPNSGLLPVHAGSVRLSHRGQSNYLFLDGRVSLDPPLLQNVTSQPNFWIGRP